MTMKFSEGSRKAGAPNQPALHTPTHGGQGYPILPPIPTQPQLPGRSGLFFRLTSRLCYSSRDNSEQSSIRDPAWRCQSASIQTLPFQEIARNDDKLDERIGLLFIKQGHLKHFQKSSVSALGRQNMGYMFNIIGLLVAAILIQGISRKPDLILQKIGQALNPNLKGVRA